VKQRATGAAGLVFALLCTAARGSTAAVQLSLSSQSVATGAVAIVPVTSVSHDGPVSAIQFDLLYDATELSVAFTAGDAVRNSRKGLLALDVAPGQKRFLITGLNQAPILDGVLANLFTTISSSAPARSYRLSVANAVAADPNAQPIEVVGSVGELVVGGLVGSQPPLLAAGVLNGASLLPGPVAPGEVLTLIGSAIGPFPEQVPVRSATATVLGEYSVLFNGIPSPMIYAARSQINLIVPYEVNGKSAAQMQVNFGGQLIAALSLPVADAEPALFTVDSSGVGPGAILNRDTSVNSPSNPADKGSIVSLFATGAGQTDPPGMNGLITDGNLHQPLLPVSVRIDGLDAEVLYAGAAPGLVSGVLQVNCVIPNDAHSGFAIPVRLIVGQSTSPPGVTLAIR